jgi:hypothetical protein
VGKITGLFEKVLTPSRKERRKDAGFFASLRLFATFA